MELPYTIAFCIAGDRILMLHRKFPPNQYRWNGVGGKIEPDETPEVSVVREILEETGLDARQAQSIYFAGIVTWTLVRDKTDAVKGMYAYIINFGSPAFDWNIHETDEGTLEWKTLDWVVDPENQQVVENIPHFLPMMLEGLEPVRYHCAYVDGELESFSVYPLPGDQ